MEIRTLTEAEILAMTNKVKREEFMKTWKEWPLWGELPELGLCVHRIGLPDGSFIVAACYETSLYGKPWSRVRYQHLRAGEMLRSYYDASSSCCVDLLTQLRAKITERKKKEG